MDDLIKKSDAIDAIELVTWYHQNRNKDMVSGANSDEHQAWYKAEDIYDALKAIPSADRPQGEWKRRLVDNGFNADWVCSECGYRVKTDFVSFNYCPNCGADMREREGE